MMRVATATVHRRIRHQAFRFDVTKLPAWLGGIATSTAGTLTNLPGFEVGSVGQRTASGWEEDLVLALHVVC
jgi:hypothetical protein